MRRKPRKDHDSPFPSGPKIRAVLLAIVMIGTSVLSVRAEERWFKGNLHTHSLWSDGNDFPEMICDWYASRDYHFLALSDHNILSTGSKWISKELIAKRGISDAIERCRQRFGGEWLETRQQGEMEEVRLKTLGEFRERIERQGEFLLLQGEEITDSFESLPIHINATDLAELIRPRGGKSVQDVMRNNLLAVAEQSAQIGRPIIAHLNHPNFGYGVTAEDLAAVVQERFFEVYNGHPSVNQNGDAQHANIERFWDIVNTIRIASLRSPPVFGLATDDSHEYLGTRGASPGRGWIMVRATELTATRLITAINTGDFYASTGVELSALVFDEATGQIDLKIAARPNANYVVEFIGTRRDFDPQSQPVLDGTGAEIRATRTYSDDVGKILATTRGSTASYQLAGDELYVRARITSSEPPENPSLEAQKQLAWTQPFGWRKWITARPSAEPDSK